MRQRNRHTKAYGKSILEIGNAGAKVLRRGKCLASQGQCGARAVVCELKHILESRGEFAEA